MSSTNRTHAVRGTFTVHWAPQDGDPGAPAVVYTLQPSVTTIKADAEGNPSPSVVTCKRWKRIGNNQAYTTTEGNLFYYISGDASRKLYRASGVEIAKGVTFVKFVWEVAGGEIISDVSVIKDGEKGDKGDDGASAFIADSDDDLIPVPLHEDGTSYGINQEVTISAYLGAAKVSEGLTYTPTCSSSLVKVTQDPKRSNVFKIESVENGNWTGQNKTQVNITVHHATYGTAVARISLVPAVPGKDNHFYSLSVSHSAFSFARKDDGSLEGNYDLNIKIVEQKGNTQIVHKTIPENSGLNVFGGYDGAVATNINNQLSSIPITAASAEGKRYYAVSLWNGMPGNGTRVDRETLPVVYDGNKGTPGGDGANAINIVVDSSSVVFKRDNPTDMYVGVDVYDGTRQVNADPNNPDCFYCSGIQPPKGVTWGHGVNNHGHSFFYRLSKANGTEVSGTVLFTVNYKGTSYTRSFAISTVADGKNGTSVNILDTLGSESDLPARGNPGDGYLINGELWVWNEASQNFKNVGKIQGPVGNSAYIHVAYANRDENGNIVDFSPEISEGRGWVGFYADNDPSFPSEQDPGWQWVAVTRDPITFVVVNERQGWKFEKAEKVFVGVDLIRGDSKIPYGTGKEDGFSLSTLPNSPDYKWGFHKNVSGHTAGYLIQKAGNVILNVDIPFTITYRGMDYHRVISIRTTKDGNGISDVVDYYLASKEKTGITILSDGWGTAIPVLTEDKPYMWNYESIYHDYTEATHTNPHIVAYFTKDGKGISDFKEYFGLSNDSAKFPTSWVEHKEGGKIPEPTETQRYLWNKETTIYTDGSTKDVSPHIVGVFGEKGNPGKPGVDAINIAIDTPSVVMKQEKAENVRVGIDLYDGTTKIPGGTGKGDYFYCDLPTNIPSGLTVTSGMNGVNSFYFDLKKPAGADVDCVLPFLVHYKDYTFNQSIRVVTYANGEKGENGLTANVNLLNNTAFRARGVDAQRWTSRIAYTYDGHYGEKAAFEEREGGMNGTRYLLARVGASLVSGYTDLLAQSLVSPDGRKVAKLTKHTLSFYLKGDVHVYLYHPDAPDILPIGTQVVVDGTPRTVTNGIFHFVESENFWSFHTITFTTTDSDSRFFLLFRQWSNSKAVFTSLCCIKLENGDVATPWCTSELDRKGPEINFSEWSGEGVYYQAGVDGETLFDVVSYTTEGKERRMKRCIKSHYSSPDNGPGSKNGHLYWSGQNYSLVATDLALARKIIADEIDARDLEVQKLLCQNERGTISISDGLINIGSKISDGCIKIGFDENNDPILEFWKGNDLQYDLGPNGIHYMRQASMEQVTLYYVSEFLPEEGKPMPMPGDPFLLACKNPTEMSAFKFHAGQFGNENNGKYYEKNTMQGDKPAPTNKYVKFGWYANPHTTVETITGPNRPKYFFGQYYSGVVAICRTLYMISEGVQGRLYVKVYWQET